MTIPGRNALPVGRILQDKARGDVQAQSASRGYGEWGLSIARVEQINYEELQIKLRVISGESDTYSYTSVPLTFPSAGRRHMSGNIPMRGDFAIVGWMAQGSSGQASSRAPVLLGWFPAPYWMGHDWVLGQDYDIGEGQDTPRQRALLEGITERVRFKLQHFNPGNFIASSAQGSDLVLDEGVWLSSRRGNEIWLRDSDQALVTRSAAAFGAQGGVRTYSGPIQRDATFLPTQMFSDGIYWDTPQQINPATGDPYTQDELAALSGLAELGASDDTEQNRWPVGFLTPALVFQRDPGDSSSDFEDVEGAEEFGSSLDPFTFLRWGSFITSQGYAKEGVEGGAVYGGKVMYRVGIDPLEGEASRVQNAVVSNDEGDFTDALTEHRVEITHVWDGTLPVTEQTDGFDADRLPDEAAEDRNPLSAARNQPFVEHVLGSVVGNDAFSEAGRATYGLPLAPQVFDADGNANPTMVPGLGLDVRDHAATLLRVNPPFSDAAGPTFFSLTKDGRLKAFVGGDPRARYSAEVLLSRGLRLEVGGEFSFSTPGGLALSGQPGRDGWGVNVTSDGGAVRVFGGGRAQEGSQAVRTDPNADEGLLPSLLLEGRETVRVQAGQNAVISAPRVRVENASEVGVNALTAVNVQSGDGVNITSKTYNRTTNGKSTETFSGPKDALITNGPVRKIDIIANPATGFVAGTNDQYLNIYGDREETFLFGNHTTQCVVGNLTYRTGIGLATLQSGASQVSVGPSGVNALAAVGNVTVNAPAGTLFASATAGATVRSSGPAVLSGSVGVTLGGPGKVGPIVSGSDLDPLTGLPLIALGMGSPGHLLGPAV